MTILASDIKLAESQVMDDVPEGGGPPTANLIADATQNSIFNDISELDRAGGRVNMRKTFVSVRTPNRDGYFGCNVIVADPPADPNVSVTIFSTEDVFDTRDDASFRIEAYLNAGPEWPGYLYENHITGQRSIQIITRTNVATPPVGRTLLLRMNEGLETQFEQYVRITRVASEERTFTDDKGDFFALIVTCDISDALRFDFPGSPANRLFSKAVGKTLTRDTVVADAGSYNGVVPLTAAVDIGDTVISAESVYSQLVPNARTETPLTDQVPSGETSNVIATTPREVVVPEAPFSQRVRIGQENRSFNYTTILTPLPARGTVRVTYRALGQNYAITDNGDGTMSGSGTGTVNYLTGSVNVTLQALPDDRSAVVFYWGQNTAYTNRSGQAGFRPPEYAFTLEHDGVVPGTPVFTWTSGGLTKTATTSVKGVISGDATGEVNHVAGNVLLRPTAMPDSGGEIQIAYDWAELVQESFPGLTVDGTGSVQFTLSQQPAPGTLQIWWLTTKTVTASSGTTMAAGSTQKAQASMSGNSTTKQTTVVAARYTEPRGSNYPGTGGTLGVPFAGFSTPGFTTTSESSNSTGANSGSTYGASYSTTSTQTSKTSVTTSHLVTDDGSGLLFGTFGTVGYVSKAVSVKVQRDASETSYQSNHEDASNWEALNATSESTTTANNTNGTGGSAATLASASSGGGGSTTAKGGAYGSTSVVDVFGVNTLSVAYRVGSATPTSKVDTYTPPATVIDLCPYTSDSIVPGSVRFTWMGHVYDDFEGKLYRGRTDVDPGLHVGSVNYESGLAVVFDYIIGGPPTAFTLNSLWTRKPKGQIANVTFATPIAPVVPGGLTISVLDVEGNQILATANINGTITGTHTRGVIDYETGLVEMQFGDYVLDTSLTAAQKTEWWYDAGNIRTADGKIWRPWPVDPESLRYNVVAYFYLPLDASILGLDPVRLPQDGRVPIFRPGGFVVLGHTGTVGPATVSNTQVINAGRVRLSRWRVIGNNGQVITTGYTADLDAGTLTVNDITGWSQPVTFEHRVEDMAMVAEVQINGTLRLTRQITHAYPVPGSYVSSALVAGDLKARVSVTFDQSTWANVWADAQSGASATGTFNSVGNPIVVTNEGALTERWAVVFVNSTSFNVIGEHVGVIATGNTSADCSPINPASGTPYFTIPALGWGLGWATGNVFRFNTVGAYFPVWVVRTIQQGPETEPDDSFTLLIRGDVDNP